MGELVNLKEYRAWKSKQDEEKKQTEKGIVINELEALKNALDAIVKDLPDQTHSMTHPSIESDLDAFMSKGSDPGDLDGYLLNLGLTIDYDETDET
jgi:hypothetical protein